ncbi:alanyl-tRNA editing protein [Pullulanibacillus camelliae]|uniref:Alanyl-tRNA editing protein n=1 Tax=Pullulanibacillus camelliae TaxID=1707096 RepID=A0A8J2VVX7_9BACL|nr:DHHA1 domain-containing protein [Pullulanibacillus camelliae]GGE39630.1 alanyl-tRNA editing protein [Pullulanibacillus camelliae]
MTKAVYYEDAYIKQFTSLIVQTGVDQAERPYVILEETAFYPTGGGQPSDQGTIEDIPVIDVEKSNDAIIHYLKSPLKMKQGTKVTGRLDWERRFDHMQQHAGQHLLSAVFADHFGWQTTSFHLGREINTIDLSTDSLSEAAVHEVEQAVNTVVFEHRPITATWVEGDDWQRYPLRKPPTVSENIRIVMIDRIDYNACGGTHPKGTGEIGAVKVLGWQRHKQGTRVSFICGWRVIHDFGKKQQLLKQLTQALNSPEDELPTAIDQLFDRQDKLQKKVEEQNDTLLDYEIRDLIAEAQPFHTYKLISTSFVDRSVKTCQKLVGSITDQEPRAIVLAVIHNDARLHFIAARGTEPHYNMNAIVRQALPFINGKGGGRPERAQGGGEAVVTPDFFLKHATQFLEKETLVEE